MKFFYLWQLDDSKNYKQESNINILHYIAPGGFLVKIIYLPMH